jgi:NADH-quinone oxidoreductase subunit J
VPRQHPPEAEGTETDSVKDLSLGTLVFYGLAAWTILSAAGVAFTRNIVHAALYLLFAFAGIVGLYAWLAADFVAVVQLLVYIGGILVLTIFAVMLTHRIADVEISNRAVGRGPALAIVLAVAGLLGRAVATASWRVAEPAEPRPTTYGIGEAFLGPYVLPFELASLVLLAALVGAIVLSRKELRSR